MISIVNSAYFWCGLYEDMIIFYDESLICHIAEACLNHNMTIMIQDANQSLFHLELM